MIYGNYLSESFLNIDNIFDEDFELSVEEINSICEFFQNISDDDTFDEAVINSIVEAATENMSEKDIKFKKFLDNNKSKFDMNAATKCSAKMEKKLGLSNHFIIGTASNIAAGIVKIIKSEGINKDSKTKINKLINTEFGKFVESINQTNIPEDSGKKFSKAKLKKSIVLLCRVVFENSIIALVLSSLFGPVGNYITGIIVAPIVEEMAKSAAVKGNFIAEFQFVFNLFEFSSYMKNMAVNNAAGFTNTHMGKFAIVRLATVGMHLTTSIVHYISSNSKLLQKLKIKNEDDEKNAKGIGLIIGFLIHAIWNTAGAVNNNKLLGAIQK